MEIQEPLHADETPYERMATHPDMLHIWYARNEIEFRYILRNIVDVEEIRQFAPGDNDYPVMIFCYPSRQVLTTFSRDHVTEIVRHYQQAIDTMAEAFKEMPN